MMHFQNYNLLNFIKLLNSFYASLNYIQGSIDNTQTLKFWVHVQ